MNEESRTLIHCPSFNVHRQVKNDGVYDETNWNYCQTE